MTNHNLIRHIRADSRGSTIVEFALLAPVIFGLMLGVLQVGLQMHASNAVRSIVTESARYTMVEYQKDNDITTEQIESRMLALAVNPPYGLSIDNVTVQVSQVASGIAGTRRYNMRMSYVPHGVLGVLGIGSPTITVNRPVYVS